MKIIQTKETMIAVMTNEESSMLVTKAEVLKALQAKFKELALAYRENFLRQYQNADNDVQQSVIKSMATVSGDTYQATCLAAYAALDSIQSDRQTVTE